MRIYTKTGDAGETGLFDGTRVPKDHERIRTYGALDEAISAIGLAHALSVDAAIGASLVRMQEQLFCVGGELATPAAEGRVDPRVPLIGDDDVAWLERTIDQAEAELPRLRNFVLPGGHPAAAALQIARSVLRRAERHAVALHRAAPLRPVVLRYLNRLSDTLFVLGRLQNLKAGTPEPIWNPKKK